MQLDQTLISIHERGLLETLDLSLHTVRRIFRHHGLELFDVEELPTHGGSLRIFACHGDEASWRMTEY